MNRKVIFLDRDGVINQDYGYVYEIEKFNFIDGVFKACQYFEKLGYEIIIITNQSGIGRKYFTENDFLKLTNWMIDKFNENNTKILKVYHCPHSPDENCDCRKPLPGMINQAISDFDIDLDEFSDEIDQWMIDELKKIGCDTARSVLNLSEEELVRRADLEEETIKEIRKILQAEFDEN